MCGRIFPSFFLMLACLAFLSGCATTVSRVALLSVGDLEGKTIPEAVDGPVLSGTDAARFFARDCYLSEAVRDALSGTPYDTLVNAEITAQSGLFIWWNKITVQGYGLNSRVLPKNGVAQ